MAISSSSRDSPTTQVILYHKPANVETTHAQTHGPYPNVYEMVFDGHVPENWHAIGRLDSKTTGLILLTNDGRLVHHVSNSGKIPKRYRAKIMGWYENDSPVLQEMRNYGVDLGPKLGRTDPVPDLQVESHPTPSTTIVTLTLTQGKNRQVRRMFHCIQSGVMELCRTHIGSGLCLDDHVPNVGDVLLLTPLQVETTLHYKTQKVTGTPRKRRQRNSNRKRAR